MRSSWTSKKEKCIRTRSWLNSWKERKKRVRIGYVTLLGKAAQTNKHKDAEEVLEKELRKQKE